jgi:8-oxo-dGTP pyrophosphatase MutT (NUDIX family)
MIKKCGIIYFDALTDKYLLVLGKKSDKWGFPKGHMEDGESEEECAMREFFEETGIQIEKKHLLEKLRFKNNIYFNVLCDGKSKFNIQDTNEILKACWFTLPEMASIDKDSINFGLKSWLNYFLEKERPLGNYPKGLTKSEENHDSVNTRFPRFVNPKDAIKPPINNNKLVVKFY